MFLKIKLIEHSESITITDHLKSSILEWWKGKRSQMIYLRNQIYFLKNSEIIE